MMMMMSDLRILENEGEFGIPLYTRVHSGSLLNHLHLTRLIHCYRLPVSDLAKMHTNFQLRMFQSSYFEVESWKLDFFIVRSICFTTHPSNIFSLRKVGRTSEIYLPA